MYVKKIKRLFLYGIFILFIGAALLPSTSSVPNQESVVLVLNKIWIVDDDGNDCYPLVPDFDDIQPAVDAANNSDEIHVYAGEYNKTRINKELLLFGGFNGTSLINNTDEDGNTVSITAENVLFDRFTVINSGDEMDILPPFNRDAGVHVTAKGAVITNNTIINNNGNGIYSLVGSVEIRNNILNDNSYDGIGIYAEGTLSSPLIRNNEIKDNGLDGIYCWLVYKPRIYFNYISGNGFDAEYMCGIKLHRTRGGFGRTGEIQRNWIINNNGDGIYIKRYCFFNKIWENNISGNSRHGIYFEDTSILNNIFENDFIQNDDKYAYTRGCFINLWDKNYWDDITGPIYRIPGRLFGIIPTFLDWDFNPAEKPYDYPMPETGPIPN
ncbi:MAG: right-handed parallel beta-helix repeat-containing protein [Thermoplasmatales archaeon]|nr:MAG: right-handed parallel beta-helix repeat-containing protein [Thermoplasmatales archaeon]